MNPLDNTIYSKEHIVATIKRFFDKDTPKEERNNADKFLTSLDREPYMWRTAKEMLADDSILEPKVSPPFSHSDLPNRP